MGLHINDQELKDINLSKEELRLEIALMLYQNERLSSGKAAKFASLSRIAFQKELAKREIPVNYGVSELEEDLEALN